MSGILAAGYIERFDYNASALYKNASGERAS
jgi:hypothetical protein